MQESHCTAELTVPYLPQSGPDATWNTLQSMRLVNWNWDVFIWDLNELLRLMTKTPPEFNYLFLTAFVKARAAYLAASGPFDCGQHAVLIGLGSKRVQFATIYYRLLLETLQDVLASEDGERPIGDREERSFQLAISVMERRYIEILVVIALEPEMEGEIYGWDVESWVTGMVRRDGELVPATPGPVKVLALTQCFGRHRLVRPSARDLVRKILRREPMRSFLERTGTMTRTDIALEKLSRHRKLSGYHIVKYGDMEVQYYVTLTNTAKTTLYVVCADRTMRMHQRDGVAPGPCPKTIEAADAGRTGEDLYLVTFDNGVVGTFAIDFRAQKENEHSHVPPGVCSATMFYVVGVDSEGCNAVTTKTERSVPRASSPGGDVDARGRCDGADARPEVISELSSVKGEQVTKERLEHTVEKTAGSGSRVRVNVTVDTEGVSAGGGRNDISNADLKSHLDKRLDTDVREIKEMASPLRGAIGNVAKDVKAALQHVRGVPVLQADLKEARGVPEAYALQIQNRIADILTMEEQEIWRAVRTAGGCQKDALTALRQAGVVDSAPTLSRRVSIIDKKLVKNGLPRCNASGPAVRYVKSGGYVNDTGKTVAEEFSAVDHDWAKDEISRDSTIKAFLSASPDDQAYFRQTNPGIDGEAKKHLKHRPVKSE